MRMKWRRRHVCGIAVFVLQLACATGAGYLHSATMYPIGMFEKVKA